MNLTEFLEGRTGRLFLLLARTVLWVASAAVLFALCRRGLTLGDEGYLLSQATDILAGKVPYRDLDLFVTPGVWYLIAGLFSITGPNVLVTRFAAVVCLLLTMAVTRRVVRASGGPLWGDFATALIPVFAVWAWPAWSFSFYSPWATLGSLGALACTLEWMRARRPAWLVACGVSLGLAIAFKQNYGVLAAIGCAAGLFLDEAAIASPRTSRREFVRRWARQALFLATGGAAVLLPLVCWLAYQGALSAAFDSLVLRPFQGFADAHSIRYLSFSDLWQRTQFWSVAGLVYAAVPVSSTGLRYSWPGPALHLVEMLHVALYWVPVFAFASLGYSGLRRLHRGPSAAERALLVTTVFAAFFFLGVFPRADFNHLINVYPPVLAMLVSAAAVHFANGRWREGTLRRTAAGLAALSCLCFLGVAAVWMNELRKLYWIPLDAPRAGVLLEPLTAEQINHEIELLQSMTREDEPVFALPGLSMIPFLAERPMPTRYYNYYSVHIGRDLGLEAAREIERSGARVILAEYKNFFSDPVGMLTYGEELAAYINRNFRPVRTISVQSHMILVKRDEPLEEVPSRGLWMSCEFSRGVRSGAYVREHLLYRSLYHSFRGAWGTRNERITICRILVPVEARFRAALELRQPDIVEEPVAVRAQAWALPDRGRPRRLLEHEWRLATEDAGSRNTRVEFDSDLSRWEGQVLTLVLRTLVEGEVPSGTMDFDGLSLMWNDGRILSPEYADTEPGDEDGQDEEAHGDEAGG